MVIPRENILSLNAGIIANQREDVGGPQETIERHGHEQQE
jgi:hypothetical protein